MKSLYSSFSKLAHADRIRERCGLFGVVNECGRSLFVGNAQKDKKLQFRGNWEIICC